MSRIGKMPISLPSGVQVSVSDGNMVTVKGKLGELSQQLDPLVEVKVDDGIMHVNRINETQDARAKHGLYRSLLDNMVKGVSEGYTIVQELVGVGFKASAAGNILELSLGYSHGIFIEMPPEVSVETLTERGKNPIITLKSFDKQLIGQVAAKIRSLRKPEPYKGKGIRFMGEEIKKKAGKSASEK
ncbi:MAG: 50S ribosomal protein L6 [Lentimicrobium sp.]|jgi:large subunit ribosomal protein L6|nr:50S ribosomal protein L6 [Lentimicrobium sp.]MDD2526570.1 50S ribosomal protein L6 [Lentimicrobiaceae bacterium]MDD4597291.1 50S ribosomal protein L6 [Lentimicrobiaceae bacterium]MDY0024596.1 50S ribosomal protein L6 [Lentimicrobium sp.]HAH57001.1 50S ribosomal protein L6 [Bacteroidales bacterium]